MPTYEVRRRTVLTYSVVTAANETEARTLARDIWQTDAAIAALAADVTRAPQASPYDQERDNVRHFPTGEGEPRLSYQRDREGELEPW